MKFNRLGLAALVLAGSAQAQDYYGGASLSGIYSSSDDLIEDEINDSSSVVVRGNAGVRWDPKGDTTRVQASSSYYGYFGRRDRWSNSVEAEQQFRLSDVIRIGVEGSAATNISTLEARSADQFAGSARMIATPGDHRFVLTGALRRRHYDNSPARSWSPLVEADYRYRLGRYNYVDLEARHESVDSKDEQFNYKRLSLGAFYTHPIIGDTRLRVGVAHRRWKWDQRPTSDGNRRRDTVLVPQARIIHPLTRDADIELDYRYIMRRSNDEASERNGHRLAGTVRVQF